MYRIDVSPSALKFLERLEATQHQLFIRIAAAIDSLAENPHKGKKLFGKFFGCRSLRAGQYRILYIVIKKRVLIEVVKIAHRREVYS